MKKKIIGLVITSCIILALGVIAFANSSEYNKNGQQHYIRSYQHVLENLDLLVQKKVISYDKSEKIRTYINANPKNKEVVDDAVSEMVKNKVITEKERYSINKFLQNQHNYNKAYLHKVN